MTSFVCGGGVGQYRAAKKIIAGTARSMGVTIAE